MVDELPMYICVFLNNLFCYFNSHVGRVHVSHLSHKFYSKEYLQKAYDVPINPIPSRHKWHGTTTPIGIMVIPMIFKKQAGRPKGKRIRVAGESSHLKKCSKCCELGHSWVNCSNTIPNPSSTTPASSVHPLSSVGSTIGPYTEDQSQSVVEPHPCRILHCRWCRKPMHTIRKCPLSATHSTAPGAHDLNRSNREGEDPENNPVDGGEVSKNTLVIEGEVSVNSLVDTI